MNPLLPTFVVITLAAPMVLAQWLCRSVAWAGARRGRVRGLLLALASVHWPSGWLALRQNVGWATLVHAVALGALVTMALAAIPIGTYQVLDGLQRWLRRRTGCASPSVDGRRRRLIEAGAGAAVLGVTGSTLGWGFFRGRHDYQLREVPVYIPGLPRALDGYVITQISDVHTGPFVNEAELDMGLALVTLSKPDLICVTGDLVDADSSWATLIAGRLSRLQSRDGVVAVLGNHDHYAGWRSVAQSLRAAKVNTLINDGCVLRARDGGGFALLGVDDEAAIERGGRGPDLNRALARVPPGLPRILLSHRPATIERWAGQIALQLSGHTHGGQISPAPLVANWALKYAAGRYVVDGTTLYVNAGLGTSGPPARVGAPPEVTRIVLLST